MSLRNWIVPGRNLMVYLLPSSVNVLMSFARLSRFSLWLSTHSAIWGSQAACRMVWSKSTMRESLRALSSLASSSFWMRSASYCSVQSVPYASSRLHVECTFLLTVMPLASWVMSMWLLVASLSSLQTTWLVPEGQWAVLDLLLVNDSPTKSTQTAKDDFVRARAAFRATCAVRIVFYMWASHIRLIRLDEGDGMRCMGFAFQGVKKKK